MQSVFSRWSKLTYAVTAFGAGRFFKTAERLQFLTRVDLFSAVFARAVCHVYFFFLKTGTFNHCGR